MEVRKSKLLSNTHTLSLPTFMNNSSNTVWFSQFQRQHHQLQKRAKTNIKTELIFQDIMNMMKLNREYFHPKQYRGSKGKEDQLPKIRGQQYIDDENQAFQGLGGMYMGLKEYKIKEKEQPKRISHVHKKSPIKNKRFPMFSSFSKYPDNIQQSLSNFLVQKQKVRYRQKINISKLNQTSIDNSIIPGQYVPLKLIESLQRKHFRTNTQNI